MMGEAVDTSPAAIQHGGRAGAPAAVTVRLRNEAGGGLTLAVEDEGPGPQAARTPGFGLTMCQLLAQQLSARFEFEDAQPGLRAVVKAP